MSTAMGLDVRDFAGVGQASGSFERKFSYTLNGGLVSVHLSDALPITDSHFVQVILDGMGPIDGGRPQQCLAVLRVMLRDAGFKMGVIGRDGSVGRGRSREHDREWAPLWDSREFLAGLVRLKWTWFDGVVRLSVSWSDRLGQGVA